MSPDTMNQFHAALTEVIEEAKRAEAKYSKGAKIALMFTATTMIEIGTEEPYIVATKVRPPNDSEKADIHPDGFVGQSRTITNPPPT